MRLSKCTHCGEKIDKTLGWVTRAGNTRTQFCSAKCLNEYENANKPITFPDISDVRNFD